MCVIMIIDRSANRPGELMLNRAQDTNKHGIGIAWREKGEVFWKKHLGLDEAKEMISTLPVPFIVHFRRVSPNGGGDFPELNHPFPVDANVSLALEGHTKGSVLFHNGDVKDWRYELKQAKTLLPGGRWSDSRALALLTHTYGVGYMTIYQPDQRGVVFTPRGQFEVYTGLGWVRVPGGTGDPKDGGNMIWCSKSDFWDLIPSTSVRICREQRCSRTDMLDHDGRCPAHPLITRSGNVTDPVVSGSTGVTPAPPLPFRRDILRSSLDNTEYQGPLLSLAEAELMEKEGRLTKNLLKAIRKAHYDLGMGGKEAERAQRALSVVSHQIYGVGHRA